MNLAEILKLITMIENMGIAIGDLYEKLKDHFDKVQDAKKRKKLLAACAKRDLAAIRELLWD